MKWLQYNNTGTKQYFWRTTQQQEIDLIEEQSEQITAYECKWNKNEKVRFPSTFINNYPGAKTFAISKDNLEDFLLHDH